MRTEKQIKEELEAVREEMKEISLDPEEYEILSQVAEALEWVLA